MASEDALPDVQAVVFHCRSLRVDSVSAAGHPQAELRPDVVDLVARLRLSRVRLAALVTADDEAQLLAAGARAASLVAALGGSASDPVDELLAGRDAVGSELVAAARRWGLAPACVAVVGGASSAAVLSAAAAAGLRAVVLSSSPPPAPAAGLACASRASDVPRALASARDCVVGCALSAKRHAALLREGLLHALPRHGVAALAVALDAPLQPQGPWHALLHKATDQLAAGGAPDAPRFGPEVDALLAYAQANPACALVEPLDALDVAFDRATAAALLATMPEELRSGGGGRHARIAAPRSIQVDSWEQIALAVALQSAGIELPCLLKPRVACGVPGAHAMALLMRPGGGIASRVALPALAQAFVPHGGVFHKCYCIGDAVFSSPRRSLPAPPRDGDADDIPDAMRFDALDALPTHWLHREAGAHGHDAAGGAPIQASPVSAPLGIAAEEHLDSVAVAACAAWLRSATGLRLFGFDVVIDAATGAHNVVDLNYFPSCAHTPGAQQALAALLRQAAGMPPVPPGSSAKA